MNVHEALRLPLGTDLRGFLTLLSHLDVPHRVIEDGNHQVLWVPVNVIEQVQQLYERYPEGDAELEARLTSGADGSAAERAADVDVDTVQPGAAQGEHKAIAATAAESPSLAVQARAFKVTTAVLLLSAAVAGLTGLGENLSTLPWFTFLDVHVQGGYLYFKSLHQTLAEGQWWRLFSPMLLHFGFLHLAMNGLWYWELGKRIEGRQGPWVMGGLTLTFGLVSNLAQHLVGGPALFGGLSGVLYGLLGYVWLYQWRAPNPDYRLPRGVLVMMLLWLVVCLTGVVGQLGLGQIANAAHVGGLLIGCVGGLLGGTLARRRLLV